MSFIFYLLKHIGLIYTFIICIIGATLEIITDRSQEGAQFVRGFGGIGGKNEKKTLANFPLKNIFQKHK